ncbi:type 4a pilus biogenesis protein PilO [Cryobacterium tagatosivorans]|nr:type 4a pilus biogenesis protein PilO [Cryobacterium tagatosivorans]
MNRMWVLGAVLLIGIVAVLGWMLGISPKLSDAKEAKAQQATVETQNTEFEAQLVKLKKQFESIDDLRDELAGLRESVPSDPDMAAFVGQLDTMAGKHRVTLTQITVSDAQPYVPVIAAPAAEPAPAEGAATGDAAAAAPVDAAAAAAAAAEAAAAAAVPAPVVNPLVTAQNFVAVPISVEVNGRYDDVLAFVAGLQKGKRLVMVTTFKTSEEEDSGNVTGTITAFVYVLIDPNAATPAAEATAAG